MAEKKTLRCAVYTRKSTEHNLDLAFNSLDAQREACEAYIKSQAHEGWQLIPDHYDDGGLSGGSLDRPALQRLLATVATAKIDIVVVYKVDRLTRSLMDFAKLVELFDRHSVSFVSVTQSFNTTSSMGRLTLNVLLSFAQFEREVIGERVRDKIAASKRKGIWVGGPVPLGYASHDKKLIVVPEEAEAVREIFRRYLVVGSVLRLTDDLNELGIVTKKRKLRDGCFVGGGRFGVGSLANLLRNRFYMGEVVYRGEVHMGDHTPIVDRDLFESVQTMMDCQAVERKLKRAATPALLTGRIFDEAGNPMTPSHTNKKGVRYRYYVGKASSGERTGQRLRVPAPALERLVLETVREQLPLSGDQSDQDVILTALNRIVIKKRKIELTLSIQNGVGGVEGAPRTIVVASVGTGNTTETVIIKDNLQPGSDEARARDALLTTIAIARRWLSDLMYENVKSIGDIAIREGRNERHIRRLLPLAFIKPQFIRSLLDGDIKNIPKVLVMARRCTINWSQ